MAAPLVHQVNVKATPETIYRAVSTAAGLAAFWTSESKAEPKVGSIASFGFGGPTQRMRIDELAGPLHPFAGDQLIDPHPLSRSTSPVCRGPAQRMRIDELVPGKRVKWTGLNDVPNWDKT